MDAFLFNKCRIKVALILIVFIIFPLKSYTANRIPPKILFNLGLTNGSKPGMLGYYWKNGIGTGISLKVPYGITIGQVFIDPIVGLNYSYFPSKRNVVFPIKSFNNYGQELVTANSTRIITLICNFSFTIVPRKSRFAPYFYFGFGYLSRSNLVFESNSPLYQSVNIKYDPRLAYSYGIGCFVRFMKNLYLSFDAGYTGSNKDPRPTTMWPIKIGLGIN